jgi:hypothetical protein
MLNTNHIRRTWLLSLATFAVAGRRLDLDGKLLDSFPTKPAGATEDFEWPHGMAVAGDGRAVYVGFTLTGRRVQRYRMGSRDRAD